MVEATEITTKDTKDTGTRNVFVSLVVISFLPVVVVLLCALVAAVLIGQQPSELRVPVGEAGNGPYLAGMYDPERSDEVGTFRWTSPAAQLRAPGTAFQPAMVVLRAAGVLNPALPARPLSFGRDERAINDFTLAPGWRDYHLLAPRAGALEAWDDPPLTISVDPLPRGANDGRDLGFPLARFSLLPIRQSLLGWPMLASIALLGVAAAALWRLDRLLNIPAAWRGWRVAAVIGVLALGLLLWAERSPYQFTRQLPPLPWTIGLTLLVLVLTARRSPVQAGSARANAWLAVVLMLLGVVLLGQPALLPVGGALAAAGVLLFPRMREVEDAVDARPVERRAVAAALAAIFALALGLRLYRLPELPYGLWRDEGRHALEALRMLLEADYRPAYIERIDLPGLGMLPFSWALGVWGIQPWTLRTVTALAGALTVFPLYGVASILTRSRATGLLAALLYAASHWSIALSRFEFPTVFDPLLQLTALWLLLLALSSTAAPWQRGLAVLGAGAGLGLAAQTYHTGRIGVAVAGVFALSYWAGNRERRRGWPLMLALLGAGFVLTAFPLLGYALENPARFSTRLGAVSLLGEQANDWHSTPGKLDRSLGAHVMMWWARGDPNGRHVAPGRPMLDALSGLGLLIGLAVVAHGLRDWRKRCLLGGLLLGLLPSALAVDYPHAMRSVDALGFACMIAALGLRTATRVLIQPPLRSADPRAAGRWKRSLPWIAVCGVVVALNAWVYFVVMPPDTSVWRSVYPYHTQIGAYLRRLADEQGAAAVRDVYVPDGLQRNAVYEFLAYDLEPKTYQPDTPAQAAPGSRFVVTGIWKPDEIERIVRQQRLDPASGVDGPALPDGSGPAFYVYRVAD